MQIINLIIPLYNSNYIEKQLLSIKNLEKNNINLNIIYIDDGSDDLYKEKYQQLIKNSKDLNIIYHFI
jgi:glycosyltransferase involved in cell wall biosynthesis